MDATVVAPVYRSFLVYIYVQPLDITVTKRNANPLFFMPYVYVGNTYLKIEPDVKNIKLHHHVHCNLCGYLVKKVLV